MIFISRNHWLKSILFFTIGVLMDSMWGLVFIAVGIGLAANKMGVSAQAILNSSEAASLMGLAVFTVLLLRLLSALLQRFLPVEQDN